jgi:hypothetical protein
VRRSITLSAACGAVFGFLVGLSVPTIAATLLTTMLGSALIIMGASTGAVELAIEDQSWLPQSSTHWVALWLMIAAIGMVIQWTFSRKAADRSGANADE